MGPTRPTPNNSVIPGFAMNQQQLLLDAARSLNQLLGQLNPDNEALKAQRGTREDPVTILNLVLDDGQSTSAAQEAAGNPLVREINNAHKTVYFQDNNSRAAYFWYRPVSAAYEVDTRWIKVRPGDVIEWPFPVDKAYIWYPAQTLLTATVLLLKYGRIHTATINTISLNAGSGSSVTTNTLGAGASTNVPVVGGAAAVSILPPNLTRTRAHLFNDSGGDIVWLGDSSVADGRGFPIGPGESFEWTNVGPLFAFSVGGSTIYGAEEQQ